jgi:hypothetical protein
LAETTKQQLLRRAVTLVGVEELAVALKAPASLVEAWMHGQASMPDRKLLLLTDFLAKLADRE